MCIFRFPQFYFESDNGASGGDNAPIADPNVMFNIDDLIPTDIKAAFEKKQEAAEPAPTKVTVKSETKTQTKEDTEEPKDKQDLDLSPENIDKMLEGDLDAVVPKDDDEEGEEVPEWHEEDKYKALLSKVSFAGVENADLDAVIQAAVDKKIVTQGTLIKSLENAQKTLKGQLELHQAEVTRLREIEKTARFDTLEEVQTKYTKPKGDIGDTIKGILQLEGVRIPVSDVLNAKDRPALDAVLKDYDIDEDESKKLVTAWRSYRDLDLSETTDRAEAQKDLRKFLSTNIPATISEKIYKNSFIEILEEPAFKELKAVVDQKKIVKDSEEAKIINEGRTNFINLANIISDPTTVAKDSQKLGMLAKFMINAAKNSSVAGKYPELLSKHQKTVASLQKVVEKYKELAASAAGITGKRSSNSQVSGETKESSNGKAETADKFKKFLSGDMSLDDILPVMREE